MLMPCDQKLKTLRAAAGGNSGRPTGSLHCPLPFPQCLPIPKEKPKLPFAKGGEMC